MAADAETRARMAVARTGFGGGRCVAARQVAVGRSHPPAVVAVGVRHPVLRRRLRLAVDRADAGVVSAVPAAVRDDPAVVAAHRRTATRWAWSRCAWSLLPALSVGDQLLHLRLRDAADLPGRFAMALPGPAGGPERRVLGAWPGGSAIPWQTAGVDAADDADHRHHRQRRTHRPRARTPRSSCRTRKCAGSPPPPSANASAATCTTCSATRCR